MINCYEYRNDNIVLSSDNMTPEEWTFVCNLFRYSNSKKFSILSLKTMMLTYLKGFTDYGAIQFIANLYRPYETATRLIKI